MAVTGPILGVIIGGYVFSKLGGYTSPRALPVAVAASSFAGLCGFPLVFVNDFRVFMALLWL